MKRDSIVSYTSSGASELQMKGKHMRKRFWSKASALMGFFIALSALTLLTVAQQPEPPVSVERDGHESKSEKADRESGDWGRHRDLVGIRRPVTLSAGQMASSLVTVFDNAVIKGHVRNDAVIVGGKATVDGKIDGDLVVVLGSANLGPNAEVKGETVVIGGRMETDSKARLHGTPVEVPLPGFDVVAGWMRNGFMLARPLPPQLPWAWYIAAVLFGMNVLLNSLFPKQSQACVESLDQSPAGALIAGFVGITLFLPLIVLLAATVVGILVIPFVVMAFVAAGLFGKLVVYRFAGQQLGPQLKLPSASTPLIGLAVGTLLFYLLYMVPIIGFVVWGLSSVLGLGAVLLAAGQVMRSNTPAPQAPPVPPNTPPTGPNDPAATPPSSETAGLMTPVPYVGNSNDPATWARAGFWPRSAAALLDLILVSFVSAVLQFPPSVLILLPIYYTILWTWKGTSVGSIVMGLKVVRTDGRPLGFAVAAVRALSSFFSLMVLGLGFLWVAFDRDRQSWHDKIAGTLVVKAPRGVSLL